MKARPTLLIAIASACAAVVIASGFVYVTAKPIHAGHQIRTDRAVALARRPAQQRPKVSASSKGMLAPAAMECGQGALVAYLAQPQIGEAAASEEALGGNLLGTLTVAGSATPTEVISPNAQLSESSESADKIASFAPVFPQTSQSALHSCDMLLANVPAAAPLVSSALQAAVASGLQHDLAAARSNLQEAFASDDPLDSGDVIITLEFQGSQYLLGPRAPEVHRLLPFTSLEAESTAEVLGSGRFGF